MPNIELADVSNVTLVLAIVLYAIAMLAYACDFAFGRRQSAAPAPQAAGKGGSRRARGRGGGAEFADHAFPADQVTAGSPTSARARRAGAAIRGSGGVSRANGVGGVTSALLADGSAGAGDGGGERR